jgi:Uma2 family endonuclease
MPITREQCELLVDAGRLLGRYELIDGEIISKIGQKRPHSLAVALLNAWLTTVFGPLRVQIQSPIDVAPSDNPTNEPEPDGVALWCDVTDLLSRSPGPEELALVVEVADSSLQFDRKTKSVLYARAGIADYWVLDIAGRRLFVHREPEGGFYRSTTVYCEGEGVAPLAKSEALVQVSELLPPQQAGRTES